MSQSDINKIDCNLHYLITVQDAYAQIRKDLRDYYSIKKNNFLIINHGYNKGTVFKKYVRSPKFKKKMKENNLQIIRYPKYERKKSSDEENLGNTCYFVNDLKHPSRKTPPSGITLATKMLSDISEEIKEAKKNLQQEVQGSKFKMQSGVKSRVVNKKKIELGNLRSQVDALQEDNRTLLRKNTKLLQKLEKAREKTKTHTIEMRNHLQKYEGLQNEKDRVQELLMKDTNSLERLRTENIALKETIITLKKERKEETAQNTLLQENLASYIQDKVQLREEKKTLKLEKHRMQKKRKKLLKTLENLTQENTMLKGRTSGLTQNQIDFQKEREAMELRICQLQEIIDQKKTMQLVEHEKRITRLTKKIVKKETKIVDLLKIIGELRQQVQNSNRITREENRTSKNEPNSLITQTQDIHSQINSSEKESEAIHNPQTKDKIIRRKNSPTPPSIKKILRQLQNFKDEPGNFRADLLESPEFSPCSSTFLETGNQLEKKYAHHRMLLTTLIRKGQDPKQAEKFYNTRIIALIRMEHMAINRKYHIELNGSFESPDLSNSPEIHCLNDLLSESIEFSEILNFIAEIMHQEMTAQISPIPYPELQDLAPFHYLAFQYRRVEYQMNTTLGPMIRKEISRLKQQYNIHTNQKKTKKKPRKMTKKRRKPTRTNKS